MNKDYTDILHVADAVFVCHKCHRLSYKSIKVFLAVFRDEDLRVLICEECKNAIDAENKKAPEIEYVGIQKNGIGKGWFCDHCGEDHFFETERYIANRLEKGELRTGNVRICQKGVDAHGEKSEKPKRYYYKIIVKTMFVKSKVVYPCDLCGEGINSLSENIEFEGWYNGPGNTIFSDNLCAGCANDARRLIDDFNEKKKPDLHASYADDGEQLDAFRKFIAFLFPGDPILDLSADKLREKLALLKKAIGEST